MLSQCYPRPKDLLENFWKYFETSMENNTDNTDLLGAYHKLTTLREWQFWDLAKYTREKENMLRVTVTISAFTS